MTTFAGGDFIWLREHVYLFIFDLFIYNIGWHARQTNINLTINKRIACYKVMIREILGENFMFLDGKIIVTGE